jgi:glutathione S-transferase
MKIYWIKAQAARRVLALVKLLGVEAELIEVDLKAGGFKTPDYVALNPNKKAPTLVDGDVVLWESAAIMAYLSIKSASNMWPVNNAAEQVEVLRWLSWNNCHWASAVGPFYFEHIVKKNFNAGPPDRQSLNSSIPDLMKYGKVLNDHLADRTFVTCDRLTIADFQLASMATDWREAEMPLEAFSHILRWIDRLMQIPAWAAPWPTR